MGVQATSLARFVLLALAVILCVPLPALAHSLLPIVVGLTVPPALILSAAVKAMFAERLGWVGRSVRFWRYGVAAAGEFGVCLVLIAMLDFPFEYLIGLYSLAAVLPNVVVMWERLGNEGRSWHLWLRCWILSLFFPALVALGVLAIVLLAELVV